MISTCKLKTYKGVHSNPYVEIGFGKPGGINKLVAMLRIAKK